MAEPRRLTVDFHNHLVPGVDDGARNSEEAAAALAALHDDGVRHVIATPHVAASLAERPTDWNVWTQSIDQAYERLRQVAAATCPDLSLGRGAEVRLDTPTPDLADARLRLRGGRFVLVEFPGFVVPAFGGAMMRAVCDGGWVPVLAHPERYRGAADPVAAAREWVAAGARLQVSHGSLAGRYGSDVRVSAAALLAAGLASYASGDFHARGRTWARETTTAIAVLPAGREVLEILEVNGQRLLRDELPLPVPPLLARGGVMRRMKELFGRS